MSQWNPVPSLAHFKKARKEINECTKEGRKQERRGKEE
jgi:hypothetical protein